jgi:phosphoserine phosphatase
MEMIGHQGPGKAESLALAQNTTQSLQKIIAIGTTPENLPALYASHHGVVQRTGRI